MDDMPNFRKPINRLTVLASLWGAAFWLVMWFFARHTLYAGDDFTVLDHIFSGDLYSALRMRIRPLEFASAAVSAFAGAPVWVAVSASALVLTAAATARFLQVVVPDVESSGWVALLCAASPIAAMSHFQVDTVSQALANLFAVLFACSAARVVLSPSERPLKGDAWAALAFAVLCIASKETTYGIVGAGCVLMALASRRQSLLPATLGLGALALAATWAIFVNQGPTQGDHYAPKNPGYWLFAIVYFAAIAVAPLPSSSTLTGGFLGSPAILVVTACGAVLLIAVAWLLMRPVLKATRPANWPRSLRAALHSPTVVCVIFALSACAPAVFLKAGELYATQLVPFMKALAIIAFYALPAGRRGAGRVVYSALAWAWMLASVVNGSFYALSSGFLPGDELSAGFISKAVFGAVGGAHAAQRWRYSVYSYPPECRSRAKGSCWISPDRPNICLPPSISAGFPRCMTDKPDCVPCGGGAGTL